MADPLVTGGNNPFTDFLMWLNNQTGNQMEQDINNPAFTAEADRPYAGLMSRYGLDVNDPDYVAKRNQLLLRMGGQPKAENVGYNQQRTHSGIESLPSFIRNQFPAGWPGTLEGGDTDREWDNMIGDVATGGINPFSGGRGLDRFLFPDGLGNYLGGIKNATASVNVGPHEAAAEVANRAFQPGMLPVNPNALFNPPSRPRQPGVEAGKNSRPDIGSPDVDPFNQRGNHLNMYPQIGPQSTPTPRGLGPPPFSTPGPTQTPATRNQYRPIAALLPYWLQ